MSNTLEYAEGQLQQLLTEDDRVSEQGIRIVRLDDGFSLSGEVESAERRDTICEIVNEAFPDIRVRCDIGVIRVGEPTDVEEL